MNGVSIIVCCYNSAKRLEPTLRAIHQLALPPQVKAELILIDNNSTDDTVAFAQRCWEQAPAPFPLRIISEVQQGLSFARQRGIAAASYGTILFVDDDNELRHDYLENGLRILERQPDIGVLGGMSQGIFKSPLPEWIHPGFPFKSLLNSLAVTTTDTAAPGYLDYESSFVMGAASFYRKSIFDKLRAYRYELKLTGRKGDILMSGDDQELCMLAKMIGYRIYRSDELHFKHHIDCSRLNRAYFKRLFYGFGYGSLTLKSYGICLRENKSMLGLEIISQNAKDKIRLLKLLRLAFLPFGAKAFKLDLLIEYQRGLLRFLDEHPGFMETHAEIAHLSYLLAAEHGQYPKLDWAPGV
jgi:glycosyltransferase involved in cell wall biosynthesis